MPSRRQNTGPSDRLGPLFVSMPMDLEPYFERIGFDASPRVDEDTLFALHEAHLAAIPYENLDLQLGQEKALDEARFAERLVGEARGGWCYEMNGLFSCALREIGFDVDRLGASVARDFLGESSRGHHMMLLIRLGSDRTFIGDVGLGDGPIHPMPFEERSWTENGFAYAIERTPDGWWRLQNHPNGLAPNVDFEPIPRMLDWYAPPCKALQTAADSVFLGLAMVMRRDRTRVRALRDLTHIEVNGNEKTERRLTTKEEYGRVVSELFDCPSAAELPTRLGIDLETLWNKVHPRVQKRAEEHRALEALAAENTQSS